MYFYKGGSEYFDFSSLPPQRMEDETGIECGELISSLLNICVGESKSIHCRGDNVEGSNIARNLLIASPRQIPKR